MPSTTLFEAAAANDVGHIRHLLSSINYFVNDCFTEPEDDSQVRGRNFWSSIVYYTATSVSVLPCARSLQNQVTQYTYDRNGWTALHFAAATGAVDAAIALRGEGADTAIRSQKKNQTYLELAAELGRVEFIKRMNDYTERERSSAEERVRHATLQHLNTQRQLENVQTDVHHRSLALDRERRQHAIKEKESKHNVNYALSRYRHLCRKYSRLHESYQVSITISDVALENYFSGNSDPEAALSQIYHAIDSMTESLAQVPDYTVAEYRVTFCLFWFGNSRPKNIQVTGDFFEEYAWDLYGKELDFMPSRSGRDYAIYATSVLLPSGQYRFKYVYRNTSEDLVWLPQNHANLSFSVSDQDTLVVASHEKRVPAVSSDIACFANSGEALPIAPILQDAQDGVIALGSAHSPDSFRLSKKSLGQTIWYPNPERRDPHHGNLQLSEVLRCI